MTVYTNKYVYMFYFNSAMNDRLSTSRVAGRVKRRRFVVRTHWVVAHRLSTVAVYVAVHCQIPPGFWKTNNIVTTYNAIWTRGRICLKHDNTFDGIFLRRHKRIISFSVFRYFTANLC